MMLAACSTPTERSTGVPPLGSFAAQLARGEPRDPRANPRDGEAEELASPTFTMRGPSEFLDSGRGNARRAVETRDGIELAFDQASIEEVVSAVIGDLMGAEFVIDPEVSGRVTLRSARPIPRSDLPAALDRALQLSGARLVETTDGVYFVAPDARAREFARGPRLAGEGLPPGYGYVVAPLDFVPAGEMARLLRPFAPQNGVALVDSERDILILAGDPGQLDVMLETIDLFDVDWLSEMSFALYELRYAEPQALITELNEIFGGPEGPVGTQLEFVPLTRLNAVVAIARRSFRLDQAEAWVRRLDVRIDRGRRVRVLPLVSADATRLAERLNALFTLDGALDGSAITVEADPDANALLIIADDAGFDQVVEAVSGLDRAPDQVLIEAMIAEVVLNDDLRYGVQWFLDTRDGGSLTNTDNAGGGVGPRFPGFSYTYASDYVRVALNAIASVTDVEVISSPQIMTLDNQTASLQVGDQVPVVTQSAVSVSDPDAPIVNSVQFRDTGVVLTVTPRISPDGSVTMLVSQEVSSVAETTTSGIDSPTIQQRRFESTVTVQDGQTVALGGLIRSSRTISRSGVPYLQDAPVIGNLFRDNTNSVRRTELIVFLTPRVIRSSEDAAIATAAMRDRLEHLRVSGFGDE
ncbi:MULTISPECIES: secretin N-terminal domain-containing protein [Hyphobacterium]|uniref:Secretin N-terminal domain-containing protein n=1 Tax=Hyphobacterium vulgare TaxID=1736751 RepID=A0ABV6ZX04_9PROT